MRSDPIILGFDTSAAHCAAALVSGDEILAQKKLEMRRGQAEALFPLLEEVVAKGGMTWSDLAAIAVGTGPGNFTGIRIAVAAARGLSMSLGIPAIGVTGLQALAHGVDDPVLTTLPAPRDHFYVQAFRGDDPEIRLLDRIEAEKLVANSRETGVATVGALALQPVDAPNPVDICRVAMTRLAGGEDILLPKPTYLRPADAAPSRDQAPVILA